MTKLNERQRNVLEAVVETTIKTRGKNAVETKGLVDEETYDGRTLTALERRGLIEYKMNTVFGHGFTATEAGLEEYRKGK